MVWTPPTASICQNGCGGDVVRGILKTINVVGTDRTRAAIKFVLALFISDDYVLFMTNQPVRPATRDELRDALDHALRYGRSGTPRRYTSDAMARIAADALAECLERSGFVALSTPPVPLRLIATQSREE